jgi:hypothetical protein
MFEETQTRPLPTDAVERALAGMAWAAQPYGAQLTRVNPTTWMGKTSETAFGYCLETRVFAATTGPWTQVTVKIAMSIEDKGALILYASWVLCFPAAIVAWALAYSDFSKRKNQLLADLWRGADGPGALGSAQYDPDPYRMGAGPDR